MGKEAKLGRVVIGVGVGGRRSLLTFKEGRTDVVRCCPYILEVTRCFQIPYHVSQMLLFCMIAVDLVNRFNSH